MGVTVTADQQQVLDALKALEAGGYALGPGWERAHQISQAHEGEALFDRLHALCHRIEGDGSNAGYWYRRAGVAPFEGSFAAEAAAIGALVGDEHTG